MSSYEKNVCHYDKPISHNQQQTRWVIPAGRKVSAPSMKLLDIKLNPNQPCNYAALIGVYGCLRRLQLRVNKKEVNYFFSREALPYILASNADNEMQRGIMSVLHGTGNNVVYDQASKLLTLERSLVDSQKAEIRLPLLSGFLNAIGVLEDEVEIIIDWASSSSELGKYLCPVDAAVPVTSINIEAPYLSYETLEGSSLSQPQKITFLELVPDQFLIPAITTDNTQVTAPIIRSNAFNKKVIGRMLFVSVPSSVSQATINSDSKALFSLFGSFLSMPMSNESFNVNIDGIGLLTMLNVNNDATKLAITVDAFGKVQPHAVSLAHVHSKNPVLKELNVEVPPPVQAGNPQLNGFFSYGAVELNQRVNQELSVVYQRRSADNTLYPSLGESMVLHAIGEVQCMWSRETGKAYL
jgi:hypothetical protein